MPLELLKRIPISGTVAERHFSPSTRSNLWVRFELDDGTEWVGVFGNAELANYHAAVPFADDATTILVIAGGQGYVVDARTGRLLRQTPWSYAYSAVSVPGRDFLFVASTTEIWATYRDRDVTAIRRQRALYDSDRSPVPTRVALDGIVFDAPGPQAITGYVWELDGWYSFALQYDGFVFERGPLVSTDEGAIHGSAERGGFPPSASLLAAARELAL
jgi:hypothetical protein